MSKGKFEDLHKYDSLMDVPLSESIFNDSIASLISIVNNLHQIGMMKINFLTGEILSANKFSLQILGFKDNELKYSQENIIKNINFYDYIVKDEHKNLFISLILNSQCIENYEIKILTKENKQIKLLFNAEVNHSNCTLDSTIIKTKRIKCVKSFSKNYRSLVQELLILKMLFLSNVNHELKTPLNSILGFCQLIQLEEISNANVRYYVENIYNSGHKLLEQIDNLLILSKSDNELKEIHKFPIFIDHILDYVSSIIQPEITKNKILYQIEIENNVPKIINTDEYKLTSVLINLLKNAIKFCNQGKIMLKISNYNNYKILFTISDTGIGISKKKQRLIFEPFSQVDNSFSRNYEGLGIGLTITKYYTEILGGKIWVKSSLGKGSKFSFTIRID